MMHAPAQTARPKQYYRQTNDGRGYYPEFKNLLDKELVLWWIRNDGASIPHHETFSTIIQPPYSSTKG